MTKFRSGIILLGCLINFYVVDAEQFIESASGGHPGLTDAEAARTIRISVTQYGRTIKVNGSATTLDGLESVLRDFANQKGEIRYYKDWPNTKSADEEPSATSILIYVDLKLDPVSTKVLTVAADHHLPVFFSKKADFSDGNVREVQSFRDLIVSSPAPNCTSSEAKKGGGGVFRQHISRETGEVTSVTVKQSTGHASLDRCAVEALRQWKYKPPISFDTIAIPIAFMGKDWKVKK